MRIFWEVAERVDQTTFKTLDRLRQMMKRPSYRQATEKALEKVRKPQRAIQFDE